MCAEFVFIRASEKNVAAIAGKIEVSFVSSIRKIGRLAIPPGVFPDFGIGYIETFPVDKLGQPLVSLQSANFAERIIGVAHKAFVA